ncbi:glycoprotein-N-acetylgalactosamine 3-beta-galactosyltransferase 1-like isoform X1 [Haliotis rubra]|uniref:glycoprotein-N-acetylgalactosamine 3-beta-galactosyltransferase 1-like isoform X1 n=1 Tax=Haliotis rubra TaxID=36100 RepID=UPI001EE5EC79|nr:glycoprotein-N-acetylgalactosamine 3-beta-galactosyltransferase 1-like isoform X1 [Haliotis rubra]
MKEVKLGFFALVVVSFYLVFLYLALSTGKLLHWKGFKGSEPWLKARYVHKAADVPTAKHNTSHIRVFCWITTQEQALNNKIPALNETWARRCDNKIFIMTTNITTPGHSIIDFHIKEGRKRLTKKTIAAMKYIYDHYLKDYDWFLKADDDTYIVMENLKYLLSFYNPDEAVYLGHLFKMFLNPGYMSGGAGYVLSRHAVRRLVEQGYNVKGACRKGGRYEDVDLAVCLKKVGVPVYNSLDNTGRETFYPFNLGDYIMGTLPKQLHLYDRHPAKTGMMCCSKLPISFHKVTPRDIRMLEFLLYRAVVYGRDNDWTQFNHFFKAETEPPLPTGNGKEE